MGTRKYTIQTKQGSPAVSRSVPSQLQKFAQSSYPNDTLPISYRQPNFGLYVQQNELHCYAISIDLQSTNLHCHNFWTNHKNKKI